MSCTPGAVEPARLARPAGAAGAGGAGRGATAATALLVVVTATALAGCSSGADDASSRASNPASSPASSPGASRGASSSADPSRQPAAVAWSPCDGLTPARASALVGEPVRVDTGTVDQPRCTLVPRRSGGAAYQLSYLWFDGGLDEALGSTGKVGTQLRPVRVPGADAARMAVARTRTGVLVTGFVQTEGLVQSVNAAQVRPYDEPGVVAGTRALLAELAHTAPSPSAGASAR